MKLKPILCGTDTLSTVTKEIMESIVISGNTASNPYGDDIFTKKCRSTIKKIFEKNDLEIFPTITGTASNSLAISTICNSHGGIICHENSHINKDECGAPEFFSNGGKLITIESKNGKLNSLKIKNKLNSFDKKSHYKTIIQGVSVTQLAENGTVYTFEELKKIGDFCKSNNLFLHMDGARFSNALVYLKKSPAEITWKLGIDCLSLGATKNGAYAAEVIIFFNKKLINNFKYQQKRTGHVLPRMKFISNQLNAWLKNNHWLSLAKKANNNAKELRKVLKKSNEIKFIYPTHGNEVFVETTEKYLNKINYVKIFPKLWERKKDNKVVLRFVTSYEMGKNIINEIDARLKILKQII